MTIVRVVNVVKTSYSLLFDVPPCPCCSDKQLVSCFCSTRLSCESNEGSISSPFSTYLYIHHHWSHCLPCCLCDGALLQHVPSLFFSFCVFFIRAPDFCQRIICTKAMTNNSHAPKFETLHRSSPCILTCFSF
jgi:hypothetical protein